MVYIYSAMPPTPVLIAIGVLVAILLVLIAVYILTPAPTQYVQPTSVTPITTVTPTPVQPTYVPPTPVQPTYVPPTPVQPTYVPPTPVQPTPAPVQSNGQPQYIGCYRDNLVRAFPSVAKTGNVDTCANFARAEGSKYFGLQFGSPVTGVGVCFTGNDLSKIGQYGLYNGTAVAGLPPDVSACRPITAAGTIPGAQMGGTWSNAVYSL